MAYQVEVKKEDKEKAVKTKQVDFEKKVVEDLKPPMKPVRVVFVYPDGTVKVVEVVEFYEYTKSLGYFGHSYEIVDVEKNE